MKKSIVFMAVMVVLLGTGCSQHLKVSLLPKDEYVEVTHPDDPNETAYVKTLVKVEF